MFLEVNGKGDGDGTYRTIGAALGAASPGSVVLVREGVYREAGLAVPPGVTLAGEGARRTVLEGEGGDAPVLLVRNASGVEIERLAVRGGKGARRGLEVIDSEVTVTDCVVSGFDGERSNPVRVGGAESRATLVRNVFRGGWYSAVIVEKGARAALLDNVCAGSRLSGIAVVGAATRVRLEGNRCFSNRWHGIAFETGGGGMARRNVCISNGQRGFCFLDAGTEVYLQDNVEDSNGPGAFSGVPLESLETGGEMPHPPPPFLFDSLALNISASLSMNHLSIGVESAWGKGPALLRMEKTEQWGLETRGHERPLTEEEALGLTIAYVRLAVAPRMPPLTGLDGSFLSLTVQSGMDESTMRWWDSFPATCETVAELAEELIALSGESVEGVWERREATPMRKMAGTVDGGGEALRGE